MELTTRQRRFVRATPASQLTKLECALRTHPRHPASTPAQARTQGLGDNLDPHGPSLRLAPIGGRARRFFWLWGAERSDGPCSCLAVLLPGRPPLWLRRGAQLQADKGSRLFERSEFSETPPEARTAGCPVAQRRGRRQWGRRSLVTFFRRERKLLAAGRLPASDQCEQVKLAKSHCFKSSSDWTRKYS